MNLLFKLKYSLFKNAFHDNNTFSKWVKVYIKFHKVYIIIYPDFIIYEY